MIPNFKDFIEQKPLFYKEIDYTRVHNAYAIIKNKIKRAKKIIHIVGTNGKGSTGRTIAHLLHKKGYSVTHYSSPHILKFNERIWIDSKDISDAILEESHKRLYSLLKKKISDELTYFEYTTLLAFISAQNSDILVLEAGLGGEFDATSVGIRDLTIITPIGLDHQDFLGDTIDKIATTKINSIQKKVLLSFETPLEIKNIAKKIADKKDAKYYFSEDLIDEIEILKIKEACKQVNINGYLIDNIITGISSLKLLNLKYDIDDLMTLKLFGRFYKIKDNITIDVGHNPLAAKAISQALGHKKIVLIYNSLEDKDYISVLSILKNNIKRVEIISVDTPRILDKSKLIKSLKNLNIDYSNFKSVDNLEEYLVFGSFFVVESFLEKN